LKSETKVVLSLLLALAGLEAAARVAAPRISADVRQIRAFSALPHQIKAVRAQGGSCFLVLGNSLAKAALHRESLKDGLRLKGWPDPEVVYLTPDASEVNDWTAAYRKHFPPTSKVHPDFLIVVTGPGHLLDQPVSSPEKLGAWHAAHTDFPEILHSWLPETGEKCRFLLGAGSHLFANRERLRPLVFYQWIPGYEQTAQRLNRRETGAAKPAPGEASRSTVRFQQLLDSIPLPPERVVVVAAPLPVAYLVPETIRTQVSAHGITLLDQGSRAPLPPDAFPDGYHLGADHAPGFSRLLLEATVFEPPHEGSR